MSFHFISSNHTEVLMQTMGNILMEHPLSHPLAPEIILVPSMPVQRWLDLNMADCMGINCNMAYPLPAIWLWKLISETNQQRDPLSRDASLWLIYHLLPDLLGLDAFASLRDYLEGDKEGVKRWQLADRIADTLDRYQYYRPDMIRAWTELGHKAKKNIGKPSFGELCSKRSEKTTTALPSWIVGKQRWHKVHPPSYKPCPSD